MNFLIRSYPIKGESLSSYIQRVSKLNYISAHDLWRYIMREGSHYPQSSNSASIDIYPDSFIDLNQLSSMLEINMDDLESLTFIPVFKKLGVDNSRINHSRVLSNTIESHRKYCPKCIEETPVYKLIWQVKEVQYCPTHNIKLQHKCNYCGKEIAILANFSEIGVCTSCKGSFRESPLNLFIPTPMDLRVIKDWEYLIDSTITVPGPLNTLTYEQSISLRLLNFLKDFEDELNPIERTTLSSIKQIARKTKIKQTFVHISTALHFTRKFGIDLSDLLTSEVPNSFIDSIFTPQKRLADSYSCLAPWCNHYQKPGSLMKTSTTLKSLKSGQELKYYMFCNDCGTEYGVNKADDKLVERGYSIDLAWNQIKDMLTEESRFTEISRRLNITEDKTRRALIFLAANQLVDHNKVPLEIPSAIDPKLTMHIKELINIGFRAKQIQKTLNMKYNEFLFYWLTSDIRKSYLEKNIKRPNKCTSILEREQKFEAAIENLILQNKLLTINEVCNILNVSPETLRNWGFIQKVKEYKITQRIKLNNELKLDLSQRIDKLTSDLIEKDIQITSDNFYRMLGIRRTVLVRKLPELTKYIHSKLKYINES